jgi:hypothetical protein
VFQSAKATVNASEWLVAEGDLPHWYVLVMPKKTFVLSAGAMEKWTVHRLDPAEASVRVTTHSSCAQLKNSQNIFQVILKRAERSIKLLQGLRCVDFN